MHVQDYGLILAFFGLVVPSAAFLGRFLFRVMAGQQTWLSPLLILVERLCYRVAGVDGAAEQGWKAYCLALLV
jgi:K+-transporting ATPase ATPase A chain